MRKESSKSTVACQQPCRLKRLTNLTINWEAWLRYKNKWSTMLPTSFCRLITNGTQPATTVRTIQTISTIESEYPRSTSTWETCIYSLCKESALSSCSGQDTTQIDPTTSKLSASSTPRSLRITSKVWKLLRSFTGKLCALLAML